MNVETVGESLAQGGHIGDVRKKAKLDLGIIGRDEAAPFRGHKGATDAASFFGTDGDVLQIGLVRRQSSRGRRTKRIRRMHAPRGGIDVSGKRIGIGRFELGELTPFENGFRQVVTEACEFLENVGIRRPRAGLGAPSAGKREFAEQDIAQLLGRSQIEFLARVLAALFFEPRHISREIVRELGEEGRRDGNAGALHLGEHRNQRPLQRFVDGHAPFGDQPRLQQHMEAQSDVGTLRRVAGGRRYRHLFEGQSVPPLAGDIGKRDRSMLEMLLRKLFQPMSVQSDIEHV